MKKNIRNVLSVSGMTLALCLSAANAQAARISGTIADSSGKPVAGAIVSLTDKKGKTESVYSDAAGAYSLDADLNGKLSLRIRKRYHVDYTRTIAPGTGTKPQKINLANLTDPKLLSDDAPSLSHFARIRFDKEESATFSRASFTRDCLSCHSLGNVGTRYPRTPEGWLPTVRRMHANLGNTDEEQMKQRAALLSLAFDGSLVTSRPEVTYDPLISQSKIYEWRLDGAILPHDAEVSKHNGKVYMTDMFAGGIIELDLKTGKRVMVKELAQGMPDGGYFTKIGKAPPYNLMLPHSPHSLFEGLDGKFYITDSLGSTLAEFDPETRNFNHYEIGHGAIYPHTIRVGKDGVVWFTINFTNQVGRFDPADKSMKVIDLPTTPPGNGLLTLPLPYGIDVNPKDGSVWYAQLGVDKIGRIDPVTFEVRQFDSPVRGPRRQRFDAAGNLWVAGFVDGTIARIDVNTWQSKVWPLPVYAPGEIPAPYALAVNPKTQEIWINDTMMDLVWRFIPEQEKFVAYPMPLKGTYTRDFSFTESGWACTSNNPVPVSLALEGGIPELICIDPEGGHKPAVVASHDK